MACVVCLPVPKETTADVLIASQVVAFAREHTQKPFAYQLLETLKGRPDMKLDGLFVDSSTRRRLRADPTSRVLLIRRGEEWKSLGFANEAYQLFTRHVLANADRWRRKETRRERLDYFEILLPSSDEVLRRQAVLEISRGPYRRIKDAASKVSRRDIYAVLRSLTWFEWSPLYIVMLGQSQAAEDKTFVERQFKSRADIGLTRHLAAWTTAFIEMRRIQAITFIVDTYLRNKSYDRNALVEMQKALSVLGKAYPKQLRPTIVTAYKALLQSHPSMAGYVARDVIAWREWSLAPALRAMKTQNVLNEPSAEYAVSYYLSLARRANSP